MNMDHEAHIMAELIGHVAALVETALTNDGWSIEPYDENDFEAIVASKDEQLVRVIVVA